MSASAANHESKPQHREADVRHTQQAGIELEAARREIGNTDAGDPMNRHHLHVARALSELSIAIADIFDKLQVMDQKLSKLSK
jgi:hypothetical protein